MDGRIDGWIGEWMDGWIGEWIDGWINELSNLLMKGFITFNCLKLVGGGYNLNYINSPPSPSRQHTLTLPPPLLLPPGPKQQDAQAKRH